MSTGKSIFLALLFRKKRFIQWVMFVKFGILLMVVDKLWQECLFWPSKKQANQPKYQVGIHRTIFQKRHCDPLCLPTLAKNNQAAINEPSKLRTHNAKCVLPPGPAVQHSRAQSILDK
jgi:hypothetical protein